MTKSGTRFIFLGLAQALHSMEEIYFHLYEFAATLSIKAPKVISSFAQLKMKAEIFAILNIAVLVVIFVTIPYYENRRRWAVLAAWIWAIAEILNGAGHLTVALFFFRYFPGVFSAPLLLLCGSLLFYQLDQDRREKGV